MARVLRFQAGLPPQYRGDCVQVTTYIINRLPTPLLNSKTPYEVLHKILPDYCHMKCLVALLWPLMLAMSVTN